MNIRTILLLVVLFPLHLLAQNVEYKTGTQTGGINAEFAHHIATDSAGNLYVLGTFSSDSIDLDPGAGVFMVKNEGVFSEDIFLQKFNANGEFVWGHNWGGASTDAAGGLAIVNDKIILAGQFKQTFDLDPGLGSDTKNAGNSSAAFLVQLDTNGDYQWGIAFGGSSSSSTSIRDLVVQPSGNIVIAGEYNTTTDFDPKPGSQKNLMAITDGLDIFVASYSNLGEYQWAVPLQGDGYDVVNAIDCDQNGRIAVTGYFTGQIDLDPGTNRAFRLSADKYDAFLVLLDSNGTYLWDAFYSGTQSELGRAVAFAEDGSVWCSGYFEDSLNIGLSGSAQWVVSNGSSDIWLSHFNADGSNHRFWHYGGISIDNIAGIDFPNPGQIMCVGTFTMSMDIDPGSTTQELKASSSGAFYLLADTNMNPISAGSIDDAGTQYGYQVICDKKGAWFCGAFNGKIDLDPGAGTDVHTSNGSYDAWVVRMAICDTTIVPTEKVLFREISSCAIYPVAPTAHSECLGEIIGSPDVSFPITETGVTVVTWTYDNGQGNTKTQKQIFQINPLDTGYILGSGVIESKQSNVSYQWLDCDDGMKPISGETSKSFMPRKTGSYAVRLTDNDCVQDGKCVDVSVIGIENLQSINTRIYPNPSRGNVAIESSIRPDAIRVFSTEGRLVIEIHPTGTFSEVQFNQPGMYLIETEVGSKHFTSKLIITN